MELTFISEVIQLKTNGIVTLGNVTTYKYIFSMSSSKVNILKHFSFWEDQTEFWFYPHRIEEEGLKYGAQAWSKT